MRKRLYIVRREAGGIGGAEKVANRFAKSFSEHFDVELLFAGKEIHGGRLQGTRGPSWLKCLRFAKSTRQFLAKEHDALVLSMERGVPGTIYRTGDGVHKVWLRHKYGNSIKWIFNPLHWILPRLEKVSMLQSQTVVSNSRMVDLEIREYYQIQSEKLKVINNGFDSKVFHPLDEQSRFELRKKFGVSSDKVNLLFSGSGWERKGLSWAIELLVQLAKEGSEAHLWVAGKGEPKKFIQKAKNQGVENSITFLGPAKEIPKWYQIIDFMILPTSYDPFSNSCLEALACGAPTITTSHNGAAELCHKLDESLVVDKLDQNEFRELASSLPSMKFSARTVSQSVQHLEAKLELKSYLQLLEN
jgi:UDP-glucose:(heptosyl)LPS alpha-1,3-glucosyltransferase